MTSQINELIINELIEEVENMETKDKVEFVYRWHNGLTLAEDLKVVTGDNTFEFKLSVSINGYLFKNISQQSVVINNDGDVEESDIDIQPIFIMISQQRLAKTKIMLEAMGYYTKN